MHINELNCLLDLHVHLDGSLSLKNVKQLAKMQNISLPESDQELLDKLQVPDNCENLNQYLTRFDFPLQLLQTEDSLKASVRQLLIEQKEQGIIYTEIRFAPQLHTRKGLRQQEVIEAVLKGMKEVSGIYSQLILCCMRGSDNKNANLETVRLASSYLNQGVAAIDLAGAEGVFPTVDFKELFQLAKESNIPFTIHAGEASGAESVKDAVLFGARRIGHGIRCLENPNVIALVKQHHVTLELCPTSNLNTKVFNHIKEYPIPKLLESGICFTINTDNMMVSHTTIREEFELIKNAFLLEDQIIYDLLYHAVDAAFTTDQIKAELRTKITNNIQCIK